jgi:hypothetical protein
MLRDFASRRGIDYPLLADPESLLIERLGLLNPEHGPGHRQHRVAHPATLWIDPRGRVLRVEREGRYFHRPLLAAMRPHGAEARPAGDAASARGFSIRPMAVETSLAAGHVFPLELEIAPRGGAHLYARGVTGDYFGATARVSAPDGVTIRAETWPAPSGAWRAPLGADVAVYTKPIRVQWEVALAARPDLAAIYEGGGVFEIEVDVTAQACDEAECWAPETLRVSWPLRLLPPDLERVPEALRR